MKGIFAIFLSVFLVAVAEAQTPDIASPPGGEDTKQNVVFNRKVDGPGDGMAEFNVKFSDYRSVGGVQLPYKWTQTLGDAADETFDVTSYEINPANIAEKFQNQKVMVRTKKPDGQ